MKKLFILLSMACSMACNQGCLGTAVFTPEATLMRAGIFNDTKVNNASLRWGNVKLDVGEYANKGDVASIEATGEAIMRGLVAYGSMGASEATRAIVMASLKGSSTNAVEAICSPGNPSACALPSTPQTAPKTLPQANRDKPCDPATGAACELAKPTAPAVDPLCVPQTPFVKQE